MNNSIYNPHELALALLRIREHIRQQEEALAKLEKYLYPCPQKQ